MNILFTVNTYYPLKDGVQFVTEYHAENLVKLGHNVTVVTLAYDSSIKQEQYNGVNIIRVNACVKHTFYYGDKKLYQKLILELSKKTDVLINVCTQCPTTDWVLPILRNISCKKILYLHGIHNFSWTILDFKSFSSFAHKFWNNIRWTFFYKLSKKAFSIYDHIVQLHEFDYGNLFFKRIFGLKGCVIENAADDIFFEKNNEYLTKNIVCVANYIERKNQKFVLNAFYKAQLENSYKLILIGSDKNEYYNSLVALNENLSKKYGKKNVEILYGMSRQKTIEIIKTAWAYVLGSRWEAYPISIVESMAAGVPFISTDVGCVKYLPGGVVVKTVDEMGYWLSFFSKNECTRISMGILGKEYAQKNLTTMSKTLALQSLIEN